MFTGFLYRTRVVRRLCIPSEGKALKKYARFFFSFLENKFPALLSIHNLREARADCEL